MKIRKTHTKNRIVFMSILILLLTAPILNGKVPQKRVIDDTQGKMVICVDNPAEPEVASKMQLDEITRKQLEYLLKIPEAVNAITRDDFSKPTTRALKEKIASLLKNAAEIEPDECSKKYLNALSDGVLAGMFFSALPELQGVKLNKAEIVFIPTVNPQDKKMFDTYIYVNDIDETRKIEEYTRRFDKIQENLPVKSASVVPYTTTAPSIKIAQLVYSSRPGAFSLIYPAPSMIEQGNYPGRAYKIVIFKNLTDAYVENVFKTIEERNIDGSVDSESFLSNMALHRISHHIGKVFLIMPKKDKNKQDETETGTSATTATKPGSDEKELKLLSDVLGPSFTLVEELKTSAVALFSVSTIKEEGLIPPEKEISLYNTYLVSLLDRLRRSSGGPSAAADIIQFNYLLKKGAISFNINTKKLSVQTLTFAKVVEEFTKASIEQSMDFYDIIRENSKTGTEITEILGSLVDIPKSVTFQF